MGIISDSGLVLNSFSPVGDEGQDLEITLDSITIGEPGWDRITFSSFKVLAGLILDRIKTWTGLRHQAKRQQVKTEDGIPMNIKISHDELGFLGYGYWKIIIYFSEQNKTK